MHLTRYTIMYIILSMMDLGQLQEKARVEGVSVHLILKEQIHLLVLEHLFRKGTFSHLVFQGGTALRMAYQGIRYSEDLDFVLRRKSARFFGNLPQVLQGLPSLLRQFPLFGQAITLKEQKGTSSFRRFILNVPIEGLSVRDRTNIEIAHVPSYENKPVILRDEQIPAHPAVQVEAPREILSDKLVAFGAREYVKGRDLWDIHFLLTTLGQSVTPSVRRMVGRKLLDYRLGPARFSARFRENLSILKGKGAALLRMEMDRFLPKTYRDLYGDRYPEISRAVSQVLADFIEGYRPRGRR